MWPVRLNFGLEAAIYYWTILLIYLSHLSKVANYLILCIDIENLTIDQNSSWICYLCRTRSISQIAVTKVIQVAEVWWCLDDDTCAIFVTCITHALESMPRPLSLMRVTGLRSTPLTLSKPFSVLLSMTYRWAANDENENVVLLSVHIFIFGS